MASINYETKLRPCLVGTKTGLKEKALFHCWEHYSQVLEPSPMVGGHLGGTISTVYAIVELENGSITRVDPIYIQVVDHKIEQYVF